MDYHGLLWIVFNGLLCIIIDDHYELSLRSIITGSIITDYHYGLSLWIITMDCYCRLSLWIIIPDYHSGLSWMILDYYYKLLWMNDGSLNILGY